MADIAWNDLVARPVMLDSLLIFDGTKPIPKTLTFCQSCGEWLPSLSERKQVEELIAAIRLLVAMPELTGARLESADRPDLRVHFGGRIYGLEVTRITRGGPDMISRAQWRRVVERTARLLWRDRGHRPVWVNVRWNPDPPRADAQAVATLLVDLVEGHLTMLPAEDHGWTDIEPRQVPDDLAWYVHGLHILRTREDDRWVSGFSNMPDVQLHELQQKIDRKGQIVAGYASHNDGLWLLIYAEASNAAQALDITDEARSATYSGPFDRVFFLDCREQAAELRLQ